MKIVHVVEASAAGTLSMVCILANAQVNGGDEVEIVFSLRPETPVDFRVMFDGKISFTQIEMCTKTEKLVAIRRLRSHLKRGDFDVLFMHSSFAGFVGRIASININGLHKVFYLPHCISFMRRDISFIKAVVFVLLEWIGCFNRRSQYIACSRSELSAIRKWVPFAKCHLVENAVSFSKSHDHSGKVAGRVVTVGQIRKQKGPEDFIRIVEEINKVSDDFEFIWIGDGDDGFKRELIAAGVFVTGWKTQDEVFRLVGESQLYLSCARWEGMPVSIIEAKYVKVPVIASECAGNIDVIIHERTGWLYKTPDSAVALILNLAKNHVMLNEVSENAYIEAVDRFNEQRYVRDLRSLCGIG